MSLVDVVHRFKTVTTNRYIEGVKESGWRQFSGRLWQRNYYEHIVRNDDELTRIREYIFSNASVGERPRESFTFAGPTAGPQG
jgi:REP element-mobilizing transposase RayT